MTLPPDPDLAPVAAAQAFLDAEAARAALPREAPGRPTIAPLEPARWSARIPLRFPLLVDGRPLETVTLRLLTGNDVTGLLLDDPDETTLGVRAQALCVGVHPDVLMAMAADDAATVVAATRPFLPSALVSGPEDGAAPDAPAT